LKLEGVNEAFVHSEAAGRITQSGILFPGKEVLMTSAFYA